VEQFERIRRDARDEGLSIRALASRHGVHRRTVRQALADATPPPRKTPDRVAPVLGPHEATVRRWLTEDLEAPRKQRHTARRVWQRLVDEEGASVAESSVRALVARLRVEVGVGSRPVMVPQSHPPAEEAEVDFGEFTAVVAGVVMKLFMFCLRLSHSGKAVHIAYANQAQESFLDGHVRAFEALGGVPVGMIRYDNLKPAVIRVALGRERFEHPRFVALRSHYGYDSFYCLPGKDGAHEKGGVEGEIGRFRRRHLTPVPHVGSLAALNEALAAADAADDARRIGARAETVGAAAARELPLLRPLPDEGFDVSAALSCRMDAKARVCVRQSYYSVPARYAGRRLEVRLGATTIRVLDPSSHGRVVAEHVRSLHKGTEDLLLDHYLEVLGRKPGALAGSTALASARASGAFTPTHQRFWDAARRQLGDGPGTRALVGVLLLHRTMTPAQVEAGMDAAVASGRFDPDLVAVEARHASEPPTAPAPVPVPLPVGANPTAAVTRPAPSLAGYDQLLIPTPTTPTPTTLTPASGIGPQLQEATA
jgi:transposase